MIWVQASESEPEKSTKLVASIEEHSISISALRRVKSIWLISFLSSENEPL